MIAPAQARRFGAHPNAFGFLRLLFASLVIVSHTPAYADGGSGRRDLVFRLFGTRSAGELAVAGFFLISGYLITASWQGSRGAGQFLLKRAARIYPGFLVAFAVSVFVVAPLTGGRWGLAATAAYTARTAPLLGYPVVPGAFAASPFPLLNGALWTVAYEFRCYLLAMALGWAGVLRRPVLVAVLAAAALLAAQLVPGWLEASQLGHPRRELLLGRPVEGLRFAGWFLAGAAFLGWRERIALRRRWAVLAAAVLLAGLGSRWAVDAAVATAGAYLVFFAAAAGHGTLLGRVNDRTDISYGVYLYASLFINLLLVASGPATPLWQVGLGAWLLSCAAGWLSWTLVERPVLRLLPHRRRLTPAAACG